MSPESDVLEALYAPDEVDRIRRAAGRVVRRSGRGELTLIKQPGWAAVPVASTDHFSAADEARLLQAMRGSVRRDVWAVALEPLDNFPPAFAVPPNAGGISAFNYECAHFNFALFAGEPSWIVICTTDEYFIVAGSPGFVESALGCDLNQAFARFHDFAVDPGWPEDMNNALPSILRALQSEYAQADAGTPVMLG